MNAVDEFIYERGKRCTKYLRRRIPADLRDAYPSQRTHITLSLGTSDLREAKVRARAKLMRMDAEFDKARQRLGSRQTDLAARQIRIADEAEVSGNAKDWAQPTLRAGDNQAPSGKLNEVASTLPVSEAAMRAIEAQQVELSKLIGPEPVRTVLAALQGFLKAHGNGGASECVDLNCSSQGFSSPTPEVVEADAQDASSEGADSHSVVCKAPSQAPAVQPVGTSVSAPISSLMTRDGKRPPSWDEVFACWRDFVLDRPRSTAIAAQTPWRDLHRFMAGRVALPPCTTPAEVSPQDMTAFAQDMRSRGLAVDTINERIFKVRAIYKIAVGRHLLADNPALNTLGFKESSAQKRRKRRLPFDKEDLRIIFGSEVFTQHHRSSGQSGEASYWLPLLMFYTGARPEEIAGMALQDVKRDPSLGWYFDIIDRPSKEDHDLFDDVPQSHRRTLKNGHSVRRVPVAQQLIDLGLLHYVDWLREQGKTVLFPTLQKDWHGKLSGAFSKFFGRYIRALGIRDERKVMYSLRHTMKDLLEQAGLPTKYLQRVLGHTSGDGAVTDGYGSDVPFKRLVDYFQQVTFPVVPALPWEPGRDRVRLLRSDGAS
jgi:integrase